MDKNFAGTKRRNGRCAESQIMSSKSQESEKLEKSRRRFSSFLYASAPAPWPDGGGTLWETGTRPDRAAPSLTKLNLRPGEVCVTLNPAGKSQLIDRKRRKSRWTYADEVPRGSVISPYGPGLSRSPGVSRDRTTPPGVVCLVAAPAAPYPDITAVSCRSPFGGFPAVLFVPW